mgnify:CR=1 FL=1
MPSERTPSNRLRRLAIYVTVPLLAACTGNGLNFDFDLRRFGRGGFDTTAAVAEATADRPSPDSRGVLTYPNYQVALAKRGDTVTDVAARVGIPAAELARFNAVEPSTKLRQGEILALPRKVEAAGTTGAIDVTTLASGAIDRAEAGQGTATGTAAAISGPEPIRHRVARGETAYSVARLYGVSVNALAEWNSLGADLVVREGQYLLIPVTAGAAATTTAAVSQPGEGTPTPVPPSASTALPEEPSATP